MFIRKIISFESSWPKLEKKFKQLNDIKSFIKRITVEGIRDSKGRYSGNKSGGDINPRKFLDCWEETINDSSWASSRSYFAADTENRKYFHLLGHCQEDVSVRVMTHRDLVNRWIFSTTSIAYRNSIINIPVGVMLTDRAEGVLRTDKRRNIMAATFEKTVEELNALAPLSQSHPFVIIGISFEEGDVEVIELESELGITDKQVVINRSIEFPPEYHSAGLGILSYFGTVLREKYPEQEAKVKIEQDGQTVRMIIETKNGDKEIIEKALHEYELVVTGEKDPESFYDNALKVIELKTELRVAYTKIEGQRDLLNHKAQELTDLKTLFGSSLSQNTDQPLTLNVSPIINVTSSQTTNNVINNDILDISDEIKFLITKSGNDSGIELRLMDLNNAVDNIDPKATPEEVKSSVGFTKLNKFIEDATKSGSEVSKFFDSISGGIENLKSLGCKYNSLAEWCGVPQIPSIFVK